MTRQTLFLQHLFGVYSIHRKGHPMRQDAVLCGAGHNIRLLLKKLRLLFAQIWQ
jgi:hypothetical protein